MVVARGLHQANIGNTIPQSIVDRKVAIQVWKPEKIAVGRVNLGAVGYCDRCDLCIGQQVATC